MMQQLKRLILAVFALTMLSWRAEADGVRLFETEAGTGYPVFHQKMVDADCVEGGRYDVSCLAEEAYTKVVETGAIKSLPASNQTMASYTKLFAKWNDLESTISPAFFQKKGLGTGFWSPTAPKPTMVEVVEKTAQEPTAVLSSMLDEVTRLKEQVATLTTQVENLQLGDPALAEGIEDSVALVEEKVAALAATTEATDAKFLEEFASLLGPVNLIKQQLQDYQQMTDEQMANLKREVAQGIAGAQAPIDSRISELESAIAQLQIAVAGKADTTMVDALTATVAQNKAEAAANEAALKAEVDGQLATAQEAINALSTQIDTAVATQLAARSQDPVWSLPLKAVLGLSLGAFLLAGYGLYRLRKLVTRVEVVEEATKYLVGLTTDGKRVEGMPSQAELNLLAIGSSIDIEVQGLEGKVVRLNRVENVGKAKADGLRIYGIDDQTNVVALDARRLSGIIYQALLTRRVVGVKRFSNIGLIKDESPVTTAAE